MKNNDKHYKGELAHEYYSSTQKIILVALVAFMGIALLPVMEIAAAGIPDDEIAVSNVDLERLWVRVQRIYGRQGSILERSDTFIENTQNPLDQLKENQPKEN